MSENLAEIGNESELAVLGYMAVDAANYRGQNIPPAEWFSTPERRAYVRAYIAASNDGQRTPAETEVFEAAQADPEGRDLSLTWCTKVKDGIPARVSPDIVAGHVKRVRQWAICRYIGGESDRLAEMLRDARTFAEVFEATNRQYVSLGALAEAGQATGRTADGKTQTAEYLQKRLNPPAASEKARRIRFGDVHRLTRATHGGPKPGDVVIVAGRAGDGKTSFMGGMAVAAAKAEIPVTFITLETGPDDLRDLFYCNLLGRTGPTRHELLDGVAATDRRTAADLQRLQPVVDRITIEHGAFSLGEIENRITAHHYEHGAGLAVVDYLQVITATGPLAKQDMRLQVGAFVLALKRLALKLNITIVAGSQANRLAIHSRLIELHHLAESDQIGQHADAVLTIAPGNREERSGDFLLYLAKSRLGGGGQYAEVRLDSERGIFFEADPVEKIKL